MGTYRGTSLKKQKVINQHQIQLKHIYTNYDSNQKVHAFEA